MCVCVCLYTSWNIKWSVCSSLDISSTPNWTVIENVKCAWSTKYLYLRRLQCFHGSLAAVSILLLLMGTITQMHVWLGQRLSKITHPNVSWFWYVESGTIDLPPQITQHTLTLSSTSQINMNCLSTSLTLHLFLYDVCSFSLMYLSSYYFV